MAVSRRTRAARWGGALLVALAPLQWLGFGSAQAADTPVYATVTGHEPFSAAANKPSYWGDNQNKFHSANLNLNSVLGGGRLNEFMFQFSYFKNHIGANSTDPES